MIFEDLNAKHVITILWITIKSYTIGNVSIQAILCENTFSQTHEEEAATREHYVASDMTNSLYKCGKCCNLTSCHEPEPYVRTTATNGDYDAAAETSTGATATTASGADENDDDLDDEYECLNTENDNNIESKMSHSYNIDKQCSKKLFNSTYVTSKFVPNKRFQKKQQQI